MKIEKVTITRKLGPVVLKSRGTQVKIDLFGNMRTTGRCLPVRADYLTPIGEREPVITLSPEPSPLPLPVLTDGDLVQLSMDQAGINTDYLGNNKKKKCVSLN